MRGRGARDEDRAPTWLGALCTHPDRAAAVVELGRRFGTATESERRLVRDGWPFSAKWPYPDPSRLGCQKGEPFSSRDRIVASLVLDHLEGLFGSREHLIAMSATCRSCELAGLDPATVMEEVASALPPEPAEYVRAFLRRPESGRRAECFGLVESLDADGEIELHARFGAVSSFPRSRP